MRAMSVGAVIFDFNGVVVDDEPQHMRAFAQVMARRGITLTEGVYFARYLGLDDRGFFRRVMADHGRPLPDDAQLSALLAEKADAYLREIDGGVALCPGAEQLIRVCAERWPLAVGSGARRHEIVLILERAQLTDCFAAIVSADDVSAGKPDPETYLSALAQLRAVQPEPGAQHSEHRGQQPELHAGACVVIEDAPHGIDAAHAAGMRVIAVCGSRTRAELSAADLIVDSLQELGPADIERIGV